MSAASILLAGNVRVATEQVAHGGTAIVHVQHVAATQVGVVPRLRPRYFSTGMQSNGSIDMQVNGAATPAEFNLAPTSAEIWRVARLVLQIVSATAAAPELFGNLPPLSNGILLEQRNAGGAQVDLTAGAPVRTNLDLSLGWMSAIAGNLLVAEWWFTSPIRLEGGLGEFLRLTVRDDLSTLGRMRVLAECQEETALT